MAYISLSQFYVGKTRSTINQAKFFICFYSQPRFPQVSCLMLSPSSFQVVLSLGIITSFLCLPDVLELAAKLTNVRCCRSSRCSHLPNACRQKRHVAGQEEFLLHLGF